jgi:hypothetical protein
VSLKISRLYLLVPLLFLGACASPAYRPYDAFHGGYRQRQIAFNEYLVSYTGSDAAFCKKAAYYRVLELAQELGFRYFKIKSEQVRDQFATAIDPDAISGNSPDHNDNLDPTGNSGGVVFGSKENAGPDGYNYRVIYFKEEPVGAHYDDAQELFKGTSLPSRSAGSGH